MRAHLSAAVLGVVLAQRVPLRLDYAQRLAAPQRLFFNNEVDQWVIGFAVLVACGSALVYGLVPALQSSQVDLVSVINEDASPRGAARGLLRSGLVVAHVAVSRLLARLRSRKHAGTSARSDGLPTAARQNSPRAKVGAPGRTRTCDPRLRSSAKGGNQGQHKAAAPDFIDVRSSPRPPETTPSRYALSVICQSTFASR